MLRTYRALHFSKPEGKANHDHGLQFDVVRRSQPGKGQKGRVSLRRHKGEALSDSPDAVDAMERGVHVEVRMGKTVYRQETNRRDTAREGQQQAEEG